MSDLAIGQAGQLQSEALTDRQRLRQAAEQFEALFVREMLKTSRESALRDENESPALKQYEQLLHEGIAEHAAGGFGVADMLERALLERQQAPRDQRAASLEMWNSLQAQAQVQAGHEAGE